MEKNDLKWMYPSKKSLVIHLLDLICFLIEIASLLIHKPVCSVFSDVNEKCYKILRLFYIEHLGPFPLLMGYSASSWLCCVLFCTTDFFVTGSSV
jgi:hypothetical protein